jgi:hypothetical protein
MRRSSADRNVSWSELTEMLLMWYVWALANTRFVRDASIVSPPTTVGSRSGHAEAAPAPAAAAAPAAPAAARRPGATAPGRNALPLPLPLPLLPPPLGKGAARAGEARQRAAR